MQATSQLLRCKPWIEAALERGGNTHSFDDIAAAVAAGTMQLWPAPRGCLVTEIVQFPRKRVLDVFLGGGELDQLADMHRDVIAWAKSQGCTEAIITGRRGWVRAFAGHGWKEQATVLRKEF